MSQEIQAPPERVLADIAISNRECRQLMARQNSLLEDQIRLLKRIRVFAEAWLFIGALLLLGIIVACAGSCLFGSGIFTMLGSYGQ